MISRIKSRLTTIDSKQNSFFHDPDWRPTKYGHLKSWQHINYAIDEWEEMISITDEFLCLNVGTHLSVLAHLYSDIAEQDFLWVEKCAVGFPKMNELHSGHSYVFEILYSIHNRKFTVNQVLYDSTSKIWLVDKTLPWKIVWGKVP